jgi:hypothetical protein
MSNALKTIMDTVSGDPTRTYIEVRALLGAFTHVGQIYQTTTTGTGAALDVPTPGNPAFAIVINDNTYTYGIHMEAMTAGTSLKGIPGGAVSKAANMITLGTNKITIGTDANLNTAHTLHVLVFIKATA